MNDFWKDLRYGLRMLAKTPGASLVAIVTIALGIGGVTYTFSAVYGIMMRGLPFEGGDRLMSISQYVVADDITRNAPIHDYVDWREQQSAFEDLAAFAFRTINLADTEQRPERYLGTAVTASMFAAVSARPLLGRVFRQEEDAGDLAPTIVLSYRVWQARYGGDPEIIGKTIRANGRTTTVIGVMPVGFRFPFDNDLWIPLGLTPTELPRGQGSLLWVIGQLEKGVSLGQARSHMGAIAERLAVEYPETNRGVGTVVVSYPDALLPSELGAMSWVMLAGVFGVLFISCVNVANLLLARAAVRAKEMAIRSALGARRARVIRQLMVEAAIIALIGGALGVILASVLIDVYTSMIQDIQTPYWFDIRLDAPMLLFALAVTLVASVASGIVPAIKASGIDVHELLKDESTGSSSFRMGRISMGLVMTEIALSSALLVLAGMAIKSAMNLKALDMGFETANVFTARLTLVETDYPDRESVLQFYDRLRQGLEALPSVTSVGFVNRLPGTGAGQSRFAVEGVPYPTNQDYPVANRATITTGFFDTFGVNLLEGRDFGSQDRDGGLPVTIVNQSFVQRYFPQTSAVGQRLRLGRAGSQNAWMTVVGVVPDLHVGDDIAGGIRSGGVRTEQFYTPLAQGTSRGMNMAIKTRDDPLAIAPLVRDAVAAIDPNLPIYQVYSMDDVIRTATMAIGILSQTFAVFGAISLFMSAVGLYGVMAFSVSRRTQEMGIRMALGAQGKDIIGLVLKKGMTQLGIGMALGLGLGLVMARPLQVALFQVNPNDPTVYAAIVVTFTVAGLIACMVPAVRATRVNLVEALRAE
ncbi:MAG: ABC transporter permease [Gemmatimonadetes bacterium]|nr:ABC transporter permease [Gemmatimonadota bacterium]